MKFPKEGEKFQIHSYKHDGNIHRVWKESTVLKASHDVFIGANERTLVAESDGRHWWTREPAICYFHAQRWFNVIGMLREEGIFYYCNLSSPFIFDEETVKYIDYDLDLKVFPDMSYSILDKDEFVLHKKQMNYPKEIDMIVKRNLKTLIGWVEARKGPFAQGYVEEWYEKYQQIKKNNTQR